MNENIIPVNNEALGRALTAVVGADTAAVIVKAYQEIDKAMADGHMAGFKEGYKAAEEASQNRADDAFERGRRQGDEDQWEGGYNQGHTEGYEQGFNDSFGDEFTDLEPKVNAHAEGERWVHASYDGVPEAGEPYQGPSDGAIYAAVSRRA